MTPLTEREATVLAYVVEHPGCTSQDVANAIQRHAVAARTTLEALHAMGFLGRQEALVPHPFTWWPEQQAIREPERKAVPSF